MAFPYEGWLAGGLFVGSALVALLLARRRRYRSVMERPGGPQSAAISHYEDVRDDLTLRDEEAVEEISPERTGLGIFPAVAGAIFSLVVMVIVGSTVMDALSQSTAASSASANTTSYALNALAATTGTMSTAGTVLGVMLIVAVIGAFGILGYNLTLADGATPEKAPNVRRHGVKHYEATRDALTRRRGSRKTKKAVLTEQEEKVWR